MKKRICSLLLACLIVVNLAAVSYGTALADDIAIANYNGHRYERIDESMTWTAAKEYCENRGGHLATITSEAEQMVIQELVLEGNKAQYWLGGTDVEEEGHWVWITGEDWSYWGKK